MFSKASFLRVVKSRDCVVKSLGIEKKKNVKMFIYLSHSCEETLGIKETRHPECIGSAFKTPTAELGITIYQLCKPETQSAGVPGNL